MSEQLYDQYQDALKRARAAEQQLQEARALLEEYTGLIVETMNNPAPESSMALYHKVCVFLDKEA